MKKKLLNLGDIDIAFYDTEDSKPPIVFVHGNSHSARSFKKQYSGILSEQFRIVAIDLPGHGFSGRPKNEEEYSLPYYAQILRDVVSELKLHDAFFAGHSLGGHIILEAIPHLEKARGVIIWGTPPIGNPPDMGKCFHPNPDLAGFFSGNLSEVEAIAMCKATFADDYEESQQFLGDILETDPMARVSVTRSIQALNFADEIAILSSLKCPMAILHGEREKVVDKQYFDQLDLSNVWTSGVVEIPGAGHSPHVEKSELFNEILRRFCQSADLDTQIKTESIVSLR